MQFFWAMVDATQAALISLNMVPMIVVALVIGLGAGGRLYLLKAAFAVIVAIPIAALWPKVYGMEPIWQDVRQLETEIQIGVQIVLAWMIVRAAGAIKLAAAHATERKPVKA